MSEKVKLVYRGPKAVHQFPGLELLFVKGAPEEVTAEQAKIIMSNNPTPDQAKREKFHDVFEVVHAAPKAVPPSTERGED